MGGNRYIADSVRRTVPPSIRTPSCVLNCCPLVVPSKARQHTADLARAGVGTTGVGEYDEARERRRNKTVLHIDDVERILRDAVEHGVLDEVTVNAAVGQMRRADAALDASRAAAHDRDRKIVEAVGKYNNALSRLYAMLEMALR